LKPSAVARPVRPAAVRASNVVPIRRIDPAPDRTRDPPAIRALYRWTEGPAYDAAFALAAIREHPGDWRPELLLWRVAQEYKHEPMIAYRLARHVFMHAGISGTKTTPELVKAIVADAMRTVGANVKIGATERAKELKVRKSTYLLLRGGAERCLLSAIRMGIRRYLAAWDGNLDLLNAGVKNEHRRIA
jgi:hypothetical protein